eukprot:3174019-Rhodomonas_salina.1
MQLERQAPRCWHVHSTFVETMRSGTWLTDPQHVAESGFEIGTQDLDILCVVENVGGFKAESNETFCSAVRDAAAHQYWSIRVPSIAQC